jgi:hypothetical protein
MISRARDKFPSRVFWYYAFFAIVLLFSVSYLGLIWYFGKLPSTPSRATHLLWNPSAIESGNDAYGQSVSLASKSNGTPVAAFEDATTYTLRYAQFVGNGTGNCFTGSNWNCETVVAENSPGDTPSVPSLALTSNNTPMIAYLRGNAPFVRFTQYVGNGTGNCTNTNWSCEIIDTSNSATRPSLTINAQGTPIVSYHKYPSLIFAERVGNANGSCFTGSNWNCETVEAGGEEGTQGDISRIILSGTLNPLIGFITNTGENSSLSFAEYIGTGGNCTSSRWNCETVDSNNITWGMGTFSMGLLGNGQPGIFYASVPDPDSQEVGRFAAFVGNNGNCDSARWNCETIDDDRITSGTWVLDNNNLPGIFALQGTDLNDSIVYHSYVGNGSGDCAFGSNWNCEMVETINSSTNQSTWMGSARDANGFPEIAAWIGYPSWIGGGSNSTLRFITSEQNPNTAPVIGYAADNVIPSSQINQSTDGQGIITVSFRVKDLETNTATLNTFEYSLDGGVTFNAPTNGDVSTSLYVSSPGQDWRTNNGTNYSSATNFSGTVHSIRWNTKHADITGLTSTTNSMVRVRFKANDGTVNSVFATSENFTVNNSPEVANDRRRMFAEEETIPELKGGAEMPAPWKEETNNLKYPYMNSVYDVTLRWNDPACETGVTEITELSILRDHLPQSDVISDMPLKTFSIENCNKSPEYFVDSAVDFGTTYLYVFRSLNENNETSVSPILTVSVPPLFGYAKSIGSYTLPNNGARLALTGSEVNSDMFSQYLPDIFETDTSPEEILFEDVPKNNFLLFSKEKRRAMEKTMKANFKAKEFTNLTEGITTDANVTTADNVSQALTVKTASAQESETENYIIVGSNQPFIVSGYGLPYAEAVIRIYENGKEKITKNTSVDSGGNWQVDLNSRELSPGVHEMTLTITLSDTSTPEIIISVVCVTDKVENIEVASSNVGGKPASEPKEQSDESEEQASVPPPPPKEEATRKEEEPTVAPANGRQKTENSEAFSGRNTPLNDSYAEEAMRQYQKALEVSEPEFQETVKRSEQVETLFNIKDISEFIASLKKTSEQSPIPEEKVSRDKIPPFTLSRSRRIQMTLDPFEADIQSELYCKLNQVATKFRLRGDKLVDESIDEHGELISFISPSERDFLQARFWSGQARLKLLSKINAYFERIRKSGGNVEVVFRDLTEQELDTLRKEAQWKTSQEIADFNTWLHLTLPSGKKFPKGVSETMMLLGAEYCRFVPEPKLPVAEFPVIKVEKPSYTDRQEYIANSPKGMNIEYAWTLPGGKGKNVRIVDVEGGWTLDHEDFPVLYFQKGNTDREAFKEHGTAVLGEICSMENTFGVSGIASESTCGAVSFFGAGVPNALAIAVSKTRPGDVLLVELQATGPKSGESCTCNCEQFEQIAMEYWQENFDIVEAATAFGTIVVAAAGNGSMNLDAPRYQGLFDRNLRDSRAILVGAGDSETHDPHCWTNHGTRVDAHAFGDSVVTTGYGDLGEAEDSRRFYTEDFKGTSSAAAMVAGAAAVIQSIYFEKTSTMLTPLQMREILMLYGTPQGKSSKKIGPIPDAKKTIAALENISKLTFTDSKKAPLTQKVASNPVKGIKTPTVAEKQSQKLSGPEVLEIILLGFVFCIVSGIILLLRSRRRMRFRR